MSDPGLLLPIAERGRRWARGQGRPTISMATFVRLMVVKQRTGWGYETLVREVSDSLHLRRFCLIGIDQRVPDESTVSKLAGGSGPGGGGDHEVGDREGAARDAVPRAGGADRLDGGRGRHPLSVGRDARPAGSQGARARGRKLSKVVTAGNGGFATGTRSARRCGRSQRRSPAHRGSQGRQVMARSTSGAGGLIARSAGEAKGLAARRGACRAAAQRRSCGSRGARGARGSLREGRRADQADGSWASRSPTGWCRSPTRTPGRSAKGSSANRPSSGTSPRSARSPRTPGVARVG